MNEVNLPAIEPVTDEDVLAAVNLPRRDLEPQTKHILEQDRRRVVERQANHGTTHAEGCVSWGRGHYECAMVEIERLRAEVAAHRKHDVLRCDALMKAEAEVAKLTAACAAKDGVIIRFLNAPLAQRDGTPVPSLLLASARAALSIDAGRNWIDATGAVEATVQRWEVRGAFGYFIELSVPDDWAGSRVLIVRVAK